MKEFVRSDEYMGRIFMDAMDRHVVMDARVTFVMKGPKLKAYCEKTDTYLQFPRHLRKRGTTLIADIIKSKKADGAVFYRAYPHSIRDLEGNLLE